MKVQSLIDSLPEFSIPPPRPLGCFLYRPTAELPLIVLLTIDSDPEFSIPPPTAATPHAMVRPVSLTTVRFPTEKIRKSGVPGALLRATASTEAPGPAIVTRTSRVSHWGLIRCRRVLRVAREGDSKRWI
jgi:hypothetical protein